MDSFQKENPLGKVSEIEESGYETPLVKRRRENTTDVFVTAQEEIPKVTSTPKIQRATEEMSTSSGFETLNSSAKVETKNHYYIEN